ncbi:MAG: hypothetical protein WBD23_12300, partial [Candidatus Acidiferrales bacterium]
LPKGSREGRVKDPTLRGRREGWGTRKGESLTSAGKERLRDVSYKNRFEEGEAGQFEFRLFVSRSRKFKPTPLAKGSGE